MEKEKRKGLFILCGVILGIWSIVGYVLPYVTQSFAMTQELADYIDREGIETGQFYYTGVEITGRAESGARAAIAFTEFRRAAQENTLEDGTVIDDSPLVPIHTE